MTSLGDYGASASVPTEGQSDVSDARLVAELQLLTLGLHMVGLEGFASGKASIRNGVLTINAKPSGAAS